MILLSARDLSRQFDAEPVFEHVSFDVRSGEKIGLVGQNGTGKTTLLNLLVRADEPDTGCVERPQAVEVALLQQEPEFDENRSLLDETKRGLSGLYQLQQQAAELADKLAIESRPAELLRLQRQYDALQQELHRLDAYNIDHRVDEVLQGLGFKPDELGRPIQSFSGGQRNRVLLAQLLLRSPDVMLLDEPTNHLDIEATEWLEDYLSRSKQAMIVVSHDRYFLDRLTRRIIELQDRKITDYQGNFSAYWRQRQDRQILQRKTFDRQQEFVAKTEDFVRRNRYGQKHAQAADRIKKLGRLECVERPGEASSVPMTFGKPTRSGDWVIEAVDVAKGFGTLLFSDVNLRINRGERVGILGANGSGKTTLLRTLIGELEPDQGRVRQGTGVKLAYFDQQMESLNSKLDAIESVRPPDNPSMTPGNIRDLLARFGMCGDIVTQPLGSMSGGERSRVALARIAALNANVLVLDEPTNHLDLWARASLEESLAAFDGTLLFVSHDRYFLDRVARSVFVLEPNRWWFYEGNYSAYSQFRQNRPQEAGDADDLTAGGRQSTTSKSSNDSSQAAPAPKARSRKEKSRRKRKFPYRRVEELEAEVADAEELLERLQADLANPDVHRDGQRVKETTAAFEATKEELELLYEHWEEAIELN